VCEISFDGEHWDAWTAIYPVARKPHRCDCCRGVISAGAQYLRLSFVYDHSAETEKACLACDWACRRFLGAHDDEASITNPSYFAEMLRDCVGEAGRGYWNEQDREWRRLRAGMLSRGRAAKRAAVSP
jgi:hypothetical protein